MEFCAGGSLDTFLQTNKSQFRHRATRSLTQFTNFVETSNDDDAKRDSYVFGYTIVDLVRWVMQISQGMEFLMSRRVVHSDLATRNVLLDGGLMAKVCDFGLARVAFSDTPTTVFWTVCISAFFITNISFTSISQVISLH